MTACAIVYADMERAGRHSDTARLLIIEPLGPQGPRIGVELTSKKDYQRFDEEMGKLDGGRRKTPEGIAEAIKNAHLNQVKP